LAEYPEDIIEIDEDGKVHATGPHSALDLKAMQPSPVRASAQAHAVDAAYADCMRNLTPAEAKAWNEHDYSVRWKWRAILLALDAAAEARGRQQAEQARDEVRQAAESSVCRLNWIIESMMRVMNGEPISDFDESEVPVRMVVDLKASQASLTQALKDYGQHKDGCGIKFAMNPKSVCTCGLDAALTGAQA
jgi:hypothetical protein